MSHSRAFALAADVAEVDLRERLTAALQTLFYVADVLDCPANEAAMLDAVDELRTELRSTQAENTDLEGRAAHAEERLEKVLQEDADKRRDEREERLTEAYSDMLAMARRFVSRAQDSGIKPRHVRPAKPAKRAGKPNGRRRQ